MGSWLADILYGSRPAEFVSRYSLQESVEKLRAVTARSVFSSLTKQSAVGTVAEHKVRLQRVIPMVRNSFKPFFFGHFEVRNGQTILVGHFTMHWFVKGFMSVWLGFCLFWTATAVFGELSKPAQVQWWFPLAGVAMFCLGVVFVRGCQWLSRNDEEWLSAVIRKGLSE
jgi:hypothetical protein